MSALIMGIIGGIVCYIASTSLKHALDYDDSLDAFGVHGTGGTLGALLTGIFAAAAINMPPIYKVDNSVDKLGLLEGNTSLFVAQIQATAMTWAIALIGAFVLLKIVDAVVGLRVTEEDEYAGLDLSQHGESGYNLEDVSIFGSEVADGPSGAVVTSDAARV
jgi:Amt family ammonium transporter